MWKSALPGNDYCWEPMELRVLKRQLANLTCNCKKQNDLKSVLQKQNHKEVQTSRTTSYYDQDIQVTSSLTDINNNTYRKNVAHSIEPYCPTCFAVHELLHGGFTKYLKDEEIEAHIDIITCDKSTDKTVECLEKTTSHTCVKPVLKYDSNASVSLTNSDILCENPSRILKKNKKLDREVTFFLNYQDLEKPVTPEEEQIKEYPIKAEYELDPIRHSNDPSRLKCMCANDIINAIRPPYNEFWL